MVGENTLKYKIVNWILRFVLLLAALCCLLPIINTVAISFSGKSFVNDVVFWPKGFTMASYEKILEDQQFFRSFFNSVCKVVVGTAFNMILTMLMAYPLSKSDRIFPARGHYMRIIIFCMLFSGGTIPWYIVISSLGLIDTFWALVLPGAVNIGNTIIMMNFFKGLPSSLAESAAIDGASPMTTLFRIYVPLSTPSIATLSLFCIVGHWNDYFNGMILINNPEKIPLQTYIQSLVADISTKINTMTAEEIKAFSEISSLNFNAAKIVVAMIPVLVIYPILQRYFVTGLVMGAVKE